MRKKVRNTIWIVVGAILCVLVVVTVGIIMNIEHKTVYVTIDGKKVNSEEMAFYLTANRALTAQYFTNEYGLSSIDIGFWDTQYGDITPAEYLVDKAIGQLQYDRAFFNDCEKLDGVGETSFESIIADMQQENASRAEAVKNHQTVYGVTEYTTSTYFDYVKSNLMIKHKEYLGSKGVIVADEVAMKSYYNEVRDDYALFKNKDGTYKSYADVHAKVLYLYTENQYDSYITKLMEKQIVNRNDDALNDLVKSIED